MELLEQTNEGSKIEDDIEDELSWHESELELDSHSKQEQI